MYEAGDADFDALIACAFNYEAHATEFSKLGRIPVLKARMNADLHMAENLKNTGKGNLCLLFIHPRRPEPDRSPICRDYACMISSFVRARPWARPQTQTLSC